MNQQNQDSVAEARDSIVSAIERVSAEQKKLSADAGDALLLAIAALKEVSLKVIETFGSKIQDQ